MKRARSIRWKLGVVTLLIVFHSACTMAAASEHSQEKIRQILARQQGGQIKVYLSDGGLYINGKSVSANELVEVVRRSRFSQAKLTVESNVSSAKVAKATQWIKKGGVNSVQVTSLLRTTTAAQEEKLRLVVARQKGNLLQVYLNNRGAYVSGKSLSNDELRAIVKRVKLDRAVITAKSYLSEKKIRDFKHLVKDAGIKKVKLASRDGA